MDHVRTQLPYAILVALVAVVGLTVLGWFLGFSGWAALMLLLVGGGIIYVVVHTVGKTAAATGDVG